jgi:hypothetical protein
MIYSIFICSNLVSPNKRSGEVRSCQLEYVIYHNSRWGNLRTLEPFLGSNQYLDVWSYEVEYPKWITQRGDYILNFRRLVQPRINPWWGVDEGNSMIMPGIWLCLLRKINRLDMKPSMISRYHPRTKCGVEVQLKHISIRRWPSC